VITTRPDRICEHPGCGAQGQWDGSYCPDHARERKNDRTRNRGSLNADWERFRKYLMACGNVFCQRVHMGVRCSKQAYAFHHIIESAARPDLNLDRRNVVGTCRGCHPRPTDRDQGQWVPTLWRTPMSAEPVPSMVCAPGERVPDGVALWTLKERLAFFSKASEER
jgi:hypothetical protein